MSVCLWSSLQAMSTDSHHWLQPVGIIKVLVDTIEVQVVACVGDTLLDEGWSGSSVLRGGVNRPPHFRTSGAQFLNHNHFFFLLMISLNNLPPVIFISVLNLGSNLMCQIAVVTLSSAD